MFVPTAQLTVLNHNDSSSVESVAVDDFIGLLRDSYYEQGFLEVEIDRVVDEYNGITQVFQSYQAKDAEGTETVVSIATNWRTSTSAGGS